MPVRVLARSVILSKLTLEGSIVLSYCCQVSLALTKTSSHSSVQVKTKQSHFTLHIIKTCQWLDLCVFICCILVILVDMEHAVLLFNHSGNHFTNVFTDSDQRLFSSCDWWLYIVSTCVFVHSLWDGSIWPGPGYPVCAHEGSVELALHRKRPEDCQTAVWDPHWKVCVHTIDRTRLRCNQSLVASWIQSRVT